MHCILWYFVDMCVVNLRILYSQRHKENSMDLQPFRLAIVAGLLGAEAEVQAKRKSLNKTFFYTIIEYTSKIKKTIYYNFFNRIPSDMTFFNTFVHVCSSCSTATL
jgi:hypothetical protein